MNKLLCCVKPAKAKSANTTNKTTIKPRYREIFRFGYEENSAEYWFDICEYSRYEKIATRYRFKNGKWDIILQYMPSIVSYHEIYAPRLNPRRERILRDFAYKPVFVFAALKHIYGDLTPLISLLLYNVQKKTDFYIML